MKRLRLTFMILTLMSVAQLAQADLYKLVHSKDPKRFSKLTKFLVSKKYHFSAVSFAKQHLIITRGKTDIEFDLSLEKLILKAGIDQFSLMDDKILMKSEAPSIQYVLAKKAFKQKNLKKAKEYLAKIKNGHRLDAEVRQLEGIIAIKQRNNKTALEKFNTCVKQADEQISRFEDKKVRRFYVVLKEQCIADKARLMYKTGNFKVADMLYNKIPKRSYIWPYLILEKAWAHYKQNDYNRALGMLVTYKSPLLESYFLPEAEVLQALAYFRMCLWKDSMVVVNNYHDRYARSARELRSILKRERGSDRYFYNLVFDENGKKHDYQKKLIAQIRKEIFFNLNLQNLHKVQREIKSLSAKKRTPFKGILLTNLKHYEVRQKDILNWFIKKKMFKFVNQMNQFSKEMYNINLEIFSKKKKLIYANKDHKQQRARGSLAHVNRTKDQMFWDFKGAFWADELGDYAFGLKNQCNNTGGK